MPSRVGRQSLPGDYNINNSNNKLVASSPRRPDRKSWIPQTPDRAKDTPSKSRFSLGRILTPGKGLTYQKPPRLSPRRIDDDSIASEDIYLTSEEENSAGKSATMKSTLSSKGSKTLETITTEESSMEEQREQTDNDQQKQRFAFPLTSPESSSTSPSSSGSTLPSIKETIEEKAEASYRHRNTNENSPIRYWQKIVHNRLSYYGDNDVRTAEAYLDLGNTQLKFNENRDAGKSFLSALKIYQCIYGDRNLSVARVLSKLAEATCKTNKNLDLAIVALSDALSIRSEILGPTHVDTIETVNKIAGVRLAMRSCVRAALDYLKVFNQRAHVLGRNHESVAATSYILGCILDDELQMTEEGEDFLKLSLQIYDSLGIEDNSNVPDIRERLEIEEFFEFDGYLFVNSSKDGLEHKLRKKLRKSCPVEI